MEPNVNPLNEKETYSAYYELRIELHHDMSCNKRYNWTFVNGQFVQFIKLYLALEKWFHDVNDKDEVLIARGKISQILGSLQKILSKIW